MKLKIYKTTSNKCIQEWKMQKENVGKNAIQLIFLTWNRIVTTAQAITQMKMEGTQYDQGLRKL